jgi:type IV secretory pathway TrbD component
VARREKATSITDAGMSLDEERRIRTTRYVVMMSIRGVLVILCGILVMAEVPLLWLWLIFGVTGMAVLPWLAVLLANDRLAKKKPSRFARHHKRAATLEAPEHRMIDSE